MAWDYFPLEEDAGYAKTAAAYNELYAACVERGLVPVATLEKGRKCQASSLRYYIKGYANRFGIIYSTGTDTYDIRRFTTSGSTAAATPPDLGTINIWTHVFGSGTDWPTEDDGKGYKAQAKILNEAYEVVDVLRTRIYGLASVYVGGIKQDKEATDSPFADAVTAWDAASWGPASGFLYSVTQNQQVDWEPNVHIEGGRLFTFKRVVQYPGSSTSTSMLDDVTQAYLGYTASVSGYYNMYPSTPTDATGRLQFRMGYDADGVPGTPTSVTDARSFGSLSASWSERDSSLTQECVATISAPTAGYYGACAVVSPSTQDPFSAWGFGSPSSYSYGGASCDGEVQWLATTHTFSKMTAE